ncbi:MAG: two-component regulator propeller domain-containing protein [Bacteroidota bacterium]
MRNSLAFLSLRLAIFHIILVSLIAWLPVQALFAQAFNIDNFSNADAIAKARVTCIHEDKYHYIWLGTQQEGLMRFDGSRFDRFGQEEGLWSPKITALQTDHDGRLWIGTDRGINILDGGKIDTLAFPEASAEAIVDLAMGQNKEVWIARQKDLWRYCNGEWVNWSKKERLPAQLSIRACWVDRQNALWLATNQGAYQLQDRDKGQLGLRHFDALSGLNSDDIRDIISDQQGRIWLASHKSGINIYENGEWLRFSGSDEIEEGGGLNTLFVDQQGWIWMGLEDAGALIWKPESQSFLSLQNKDGLASNDVAVIHQDAWGTYWLGTAGRGISRCRLSGAQFIFSEVAATSIKAIAKDTSDLFWLADQQNIWLYDPVQDMRFYPPNAFPMVRTNAIAVGKEGEVWLATENRGILSYTNNRFQYLSAEMGLGSNRIRDIALDQRGHLWAATYGAGLCQISANRFDTSGTSFSFQSYDREQGFPDFINCLYRNSSDQLWLGAADGSLSLVKGDSLFRRWTSSEGLSGNGILALVQDSLGYLWGATKGSGVFYLNPQMADPTIYWLNRQNGLTTNHINTLFFDQQGTLWLGHASGLDRIRLTTSREVQQMRFLGYENGFRAQLNRHAYLLDETEGIWLGTDKGLCRYRPYELVQKQKDPVLHFTEIRLSGKVWNDSLFSSLSSQKASDEQIIRLPHTENDLLIRFLAIDQLRPNQVSYEWKLEGRDRQWSPPSSANQASFVDLPPGDYTFLVRAFGPEANLPGPELHFPFQIKAPFWQQSWFKTLSYLLGALLVIGLFLLRERRIQRQAARARKQLEADHQLLQLEQKALQLQMNPHFIFNCLNSIQGHISQQDHKTARYQLAKFSKLMRQILESSRETGIYLSEELELLHHYLGLERFSRDHSFTYDIQVDERLDPERILLPPMLVQPFVENAIIHGIAHKTEGDASVQLHFGFRGQLLEIQIEDNGIGREAARALKSQRDQQHKSVALQVTRERLDILNPSLGKSLEIEDRLSEDGKALGTRVWIRIPLKEE